jgi:acyl dehydratase
VIDWPFRVKRSTFDDLEVGSRARVGTWTLGRDEVIDFARHWDPQPFHVDEEAARASIYGGLTASSLHLFAICTRLFFDHPDRIAVLAMLGKDAIRFPSPARVGDRLVYETECIEKRPSRSKPDRGVVRLRDTLTNQDGDVVLSQEVTLLVERRPAGESAAPAEGQ